MASDTDSSQTAGCAKWGCGCLGTGVVGIIGAGVLYWLFNNAFFYYPSAAWGVVISIPLLILGGFAGAFIGSALFGQGSLGVTARRRMQAMGPVLFGLGILCLGAVVVMSTRPGFYYEGTAVGWKTPEGKVVQVANEEVPEDSLGILGPIEVSEQNVEVGVRVQQELEEGTGYFERWNFITVALLDENKNYLLSFGGDVWNYAGRDGGEDWQEEDTQYETTLEFPSPGTYYIRIRCESGTGGGTTVFGDEEQSHSGLDPSSMYPIHVEMYERATWGNPTPLRWAAYLAFLFGAISIVAPRVGRSAMIKQHLKEGGEVRYDGQTWRVGGELRCTYDDWQATEWSLQPTDPGAKMPRYLEHEYEVDSNWENWLLSAPMGLDDLTCPDPDGGETTVQQFVERHGELPDAVTAEGQRFALDDRGTVRREGASVRYHNYDGGGGDFVTIEGTPGESLEAVLGGKISLSELSVVEEEETTV